MRRFRARPAKGGSAFRAKLTMQAAAACSASDGIAPFGQSLLARHDDDGATFSILKADGPDFAFEGFPSGSSLGFSDILFAAHNGSDTAPAWVVVISDGATYELRRSASGEGWSAVTGPSYAELALLDWAHQAFIAAGYAFDEVATSPTGETWTEQTGVAMDGTPEIAAGTRGTLIVAGYDDSGMLIVPAAIVSFDRGATWQVATFPELDFDYFETLELTYDEAAGEWRIYGGDGSDSGLVVLGSAAGLTWEVRAATYVADCLPFHLKRSRTGIYHSIATDGVMARVATSLDGLAFFTAFELPNADPNGPFASFATNDAGHWALSHKIAGETHCRLAYWADTATAGSEVATKLDEFPDASASDEDALAVFIAPVNPASESCESVGTMRVSLR